MTISNIAGRNGTLAENCLLWVCLREGHRLSLAMEVTVEFIVELRYSALIPIVLNLGRAIQGARDEEMQEGEVVKTEEEMAPGDLSESNQETI